jgi:glycosyltransferase involved in cell wall biosynthesis
VSPRGAARPRPVCMLTHSHYEEDPRVRREAESLVAAGIPVLVFGLRRPGEPPREVIEGVELRRLDVQRHQGAGIAVYMAEYLLFLVRAMFAATAAHRRLRFRAVHVHTLPDFLVFAAAPLKLAGVPVILDLHEAMPEFFRMRFGGRLGEEGLRARIAHRLLVAQEQLSIRFADAVLTVNDALGERLVAMGVPRDRITILLNTPSLERWDAGAHPRRPFAADGMVRLVYAGAVTPIYELDVVVRAMAALAGIRPDLRVTLDIYGRGDAAEPLAALAADLGLGDRVTLHGRIPIDAVPAAVAAADVGLAPTARTEFTDFSLSTKIFEYAAMDKPVIASHLPTIERYFGDRSLWTYQPGNAASLAGALATVADDAVERDLRVAAARERTLALAWDRQVARYLEVLARIA